MWGTGANGGAGVGRGVGWRAVGVARAVGLRGGRRVDVGGVWSVAVGDAVPRAGAGSGGGVRRRRGGSVGGDDARRGGDPARAVRLLRRARSDGHHGGLVNDIGEGHSKTENGRRNGS